MQKKKKIVKIRKFVPSYLCSRICPNNAIHLQVNGQAIRPHNVTWDNNYPVLAIHVSSFNSGMLSPISPKHITESNRNTAILISNKSKTYNWKQQEHSYFNLQKVQNV